MATLTELLTSKIPPHSLEAERAVLGAILLERESLPRAIELLKPSGFLAVLNERKAQVVGGKTFEILLILHALKYLNGLLELSRLHVNLGTEKLFFSLDLVGNAALDRLDREQGVSGVVLLNKYACEPPSGFVADGFVHIALEHGLEGTPGTLVHAVRQLEITHGEVGVIDLVMQRVQLRVVQAVELPEFGIQPSDGVEVVALSRLVEGLTEIEVLGAWIGRCFPGGKRKRAEAQPHQAKVASQHESLLFELDGLSRRSGAIDDDLEQLGLYGFLEFVGHDLSIFSIATGFADDRCLQRMLASSQITRMDALNTSVLERLKFLEGVNVMS